MRKKAAVKRVKMVLLAKTKLLYEELEALEIPTDIHGKRVCLWAEVLDQGAHEESRRAGR